MSTDARATLNRAMTEDELLTAVTEWLTLRDWVWTHTRRSDKGQLMGHAGVPDLIAARRGRVVFLELKTYLGKVSPEQAAWLNAITGAAECHQSRIVRPSNLDDTLRWLA